jgi:large subunit ribosomal protein L34e
MPRPARRSRTLRRIKVRTPGGRTVTRYEKRAKGAPKCPVTGLPLGGMNVRVYRFGVSIRAPRRPYGGVYSHKVLARALRLAVRR